MPLFSCLPWRPRGAKRERLYLRAKARRLLELYVRRLLQLEARSMLHGWMQGWRGRESLEGAGLEVYPTIDASASACRLLEEIRVISRATAQDEHCHEYTHLLLSTES